MIMLMIYLRLLFSIVYYCLDPMKKLQRLVNRMLIEKKDLISKTVICGTAVNVAVMAIPMIALSEGVST